MRRSCALEVAEGVLKAHVHRKETEMSPTL